MKMKPYCVNLKQVSKLGKSYDISGYLSKFHQESSGRNNFWKRKIWIDERWAPSPVASARAARAPPLLTLALALASKKGQFKNI